MAATQSHPWQGRRGVTALLAVLVILALVATVLALSANSPTLAQNPQDSGGTFTLSWQQPGDGSVNGYRYSTDHGVTWHDLSGNADIQGPEAGKAISVLIMATQATTQRQVVPAPTPTPTPTPATRPLQQASPPALTASPSTGDSILLSWTAPTGGTPAIYEIDHSTTGQGRTWHSLQRRNASEGRYYTDANLGQDATVFYRVRTQFRNGNYSEWSNTASATTNYTLPYTPVLTTTVHAEPISVVIDWEPGSGESADTSTVRSYFVETSTDNLNWTEAGRGR